MAREWGSTALAPGRQCFRCCRVASDVAAAVASTGVVDRAEGTGVGCQLVLAVV